jgi:proteasome lid subunit RPN8/RPN11
VLKDTIKKKIEDHAEYTFPQECCGLLVNVSGKQIYHPCTNIAAGHEEQDFVLDPMNYAEAEDLGEIMGVVHSHPNASEQPSEADKVSCAKSGKPWYIVSYPAKRWASIMPEGYEAPLTGRSFSYGVLDCQTLYIDYYRKEFGIEMKQYGSEYDWWKNGKNYYAENWEKEGLVEVKDHTQIKRHDLIFMQIVSDVPNHAAVYLGNNMILHHLMGRLSTKDIYGDYYQKHTTHVLRHKFLC